MINKLMIMISLGMTSGCTLGRVSYVCNTPAGNEEIKTDNNTGTFVYEKGAYVIYENEKGTWTIPAAMCVKWEHKK